MTSTLRTLAAYLSLAIVIVLCGAANASQADGPDVASRECELGITLAFMGRSAAAESVFTSVLSRTPGDARALTNLGNLAILRDETGLALRFYERAAMADSTDAGIQLNEATALLLQGEDALAIERAREGVQRAGGPGAAARLLGLRYDEPVSRAAQRPAIGHDEVLNLLRAAIAKVPPDSVSTTTPDTTRTPAGRRPVWRSAGARAGALADLATQLYWKR